MTIQPESQMNAVNEDGPRKRRKIGVAEEWTASLYKTTSSPPYQLVSDPTNKSELEKFIKTLFPTDEITMEPESKRVGNSGGFNLIEHLDRMTKVENQLENQQRKIEEHQQKLEQQQQKLEEQQQKAEEHQQKVKEQQQKVEEQRQKVEEHQQKVEEQQQKVEEHQQMLEEQQQMLEEQQQKVEEQQQTLEERQQTLEEQKQTLEEQQQTLEEQQQMLEEQQQILEENEYNLLMAHANELEWTAGLDDPETRHIRNEIIHGGDIKVSIRTIAFLKRRGEIRRAENASIGFKITYGFSINELEPVNAIAPEEIVELFNMRGTLRKLDVWRETFHTESKTWIEECDQIITAWLRAGGGSASCIRNRAKKEYMKISQQMADCVNDTRKIKMSRDTKA